jgi:D-arabinose 1-dehydrogenase-like Zn-dependent alcohol dehydrogenase
MLAPLPADLEHSEAATLPTVAITVNTALNQVAGLRSGERVLLQATAGGVGLAGLQVAAGLGAHALGSAGSPAKRSLLRRLHGVSHAASSRDTSFACDLAVSASGAHVVLNSLTSPGMVGAALALLRRGGRLVEIGKRDVWSGAAVAAQRPDVSYSLVAVDFLPPTILGSQMNNLSASLAAGSAHPLRQAAYPLAAAATAMRLLAQASHSGKVVAAAPAAPLLPAQTPTAGASVAITGGLGGLGLLMAKWLVTTGQARRITLIGRRGRLDDGRAAAVTHLLTRQSVAEVTVIAADMSCSGDAAAVWEQLGGQCDAVLHAAGVLQVRRDC